MNSALRAAPRERKEIRMPRFAANLGYLFTEPSLLERIDAARGRGLQGGRAAISL